MVASCDKRRSSVVLSSCRPFFAGVTTTVVPCSATPAETGARPARASASRTLPACVRAADDRLDVDARGNDERDLGPRGECPRRGRVDVDRDEPPARNAIGAAAGPDRHLLPAPAVELPLDLRAAVAADVSPQHVDAGLGRAPELQAARDRGAGCGDQEHGDENGKAFHSDSEATNPAVSRIRRSRIVLRMELRDLPSVDELARSVSDPLAVAAARTVLDRAREEIQAGADPGDLAARLETELTARPPAGPAARR